ncbi:MAG: TIGR03557 family F420-dependent LLM class oxidoreductase [Frankiaceae bacterium]
MVTLGYFLSSEEHGPRELVDQAARAEQAGFATAWISDHFHPWLDEQGQSPFVWAVVGGIARATGRLRLWTAVTCPIIRIHPAIVAHAAATASELMQGRFGLGVGTGENLNEHVLGDRWPAPDERLEMLEEAVEVMRELWGGQLVTHRGRHYAVESARLYTHPQQPVPVHVSAFGPKALEVAARIGDGYIATMPDKEMVDRYRQLGGRGPAQGGLKVCYDTDTDRARGTFHRLWRNSLVPGQLAQELPSPKHFEEASQLVTEEMVGKSIPLGPDPEVHVRAIQEYVDAGYDEVYVNQVGPDQEAFFAFYEREVLPHFAA